MTDIKVNGCPPGIEAIDLEATDTWIFKIAVLGDETIYRVRQAPTVYTYAMLSRIWTEFNARLGRGIRFEDGLSRTVSNRMPNR